MLKIAICDDMPEFLDSTKRCIQLWPNKPDGLTVDTFEDADSLITAHTANPFDIILLDVIMPLLGGIEAAGEIRQQDRTVKIVFLTSSTDYAVDSYRVKANDYLLKPLDTQLLHGCLDELWEDIQKTTKRILIKGKNAVHQVALQNIEYIESDNKCINFALADGTTITSPTPLYSYEDKLLLSDGFFKCSRSYIINIYRIDFFTPKEVRMRSGYRIPIARSCQKEFEAAYFATLFGKDGDK